MSHQTTSRPSPAHTLLFPLAAGWAISALPGWLLLRERMGNDAALLAPTWHGHEMLFGFALTVVAGFAISRISRPAAWLLVGAWLAGRIAALFGSTWPDLVTASAGLAFPFALWASASPPLLRAPRRTENWSVPAVMLLFLFADALWWAGALRGDVPMQLDALRATIDLFALLALIVVGRVLPATIGAHLERLDLPAPIQLRRQYEPLLVLLLGLASLADALDGRQAAGWLCLVTAGFVLVRARDWQLGHTLKRPALWTLALGYAWLIPGLILKGSAQAFEWWDVTTALHAITIGALGSLTLIMMARTHALRTRRSLEHWWDMGVAAVLLSAATVLRLYATPSQDQLLWPAALCWSVAFAFLLVRFLKPALRR